jgi:hypothetical protein
MKTNFEPLMEDLWKLAGEIGTKAEKENDKRYSKVYAKISEALDVAEAEGLIENKEESEA